MITPVSVLGFAPLCRLYSALVPSLYRLAARGQVAWVLTEDRGGARLPEVGLRGGDDDGNDTDGNGEDSDNDIDGNDVK